ncbi:MAG: signal peptidase I [Oscillospiraceae bacterium]|jgi:signal peptidase I|nr:signal peptidase I [Oscillospiraceae bacterium]
MVSVVPNHPQNPWILPPMPYDYDSRRARRRGCPKRRVDALLNLCLACSAAFLFLIFPLLLYQNAAGSDSFFSLRFVLVRTDSMEPCIPQGSLVIAREGGFAELETGDVILYLLEDGQLNTHRVVATEYGVLRTKGDHNLLFDAGTVTESTYVARVVFSIPGGMVK